MLGFITLKKTGTSSLLQVTLTVKFGFSNVLQISQEKKLNNFF